MIGEARGSPHYSSMMNVMDVPLPDDDEVNLMPVTRSRMHPGCLIFVFLLEQCIGDDKLALSTHRQKEGAVGVHLSNTMVANDSVPRRTVSADTGVEVS